MSIDKDFFYSKSLNIFVSLQPLKIEERVLNAAKILGIDLSWDDVGMVNHINFKEAKLLIKKLNSTMLSPNDYWKVLKDAEEEGRYDVIKELTSSEYVEWLDAVYFKEKSGQVYMIEYPEIKKSENDIEITGVKKGIEMPYGRPGWFSIQGYEFNELGLPKKIKLQIRDSITMNGVWKYWSVFQQGSYVSPIRGYVLSSGTPSLDLDIPLVASQPVLTLRECKKFIEGNNINMEFFNELKPFVNNYKELIAYEPGINNLDKLMAFYIRFKENLKLLDNQEFTLFFNSKFNIDQEKIIDILGLLRLLALSKHDMSIIEKLQNFSYKVFKINNQITTESLENYITSLEVSLQNALLSNQSIVFVMGHKNPDTDTVVSSIFEAYRNSIIDNTKVYIPIIQANAVPDEIITLLGEDLCNKLVLSTNKFYNKAKVSGYSKWILVDHNVSEVQKYVISIIDHHALSNKAKKMDIPLTWEMAGSTTALVILKLIAQNITFSKDIARILYGAMLMDTENRNAKKVTSKDKILMDYIKRASGIEEDKELYQTLMSSLLNTYDVDRIFYRDYKEDWGVFGYSVVKVKNLFDKNGEVNKVDLISKLIELAIENNKKNNFSVTVVKIVDYNEDNESVNRERMYFIFNNSATKEFKDTLLKFSERLIKNEFKSKCNTIMGDNFIEYWGSGKQLSRKFTAPYFEPIIRAYNQYFYSPSTKLYVKREFMKKSKAIESIGYSSNIKLSYDNKDRLNLISFQDAKKLLSQLGQVMMSLHDYWLVLKDAYDLNDTQMTSHLRSKDFVEFLDTVFLDNKFIINNPTFGKKEELVGEKQEVKIIDGFPALISKDDIDFKTGLPCRVQDANQYADKELWRYWSPDADICIATRGHIFLLNQSAVDTKIHFDDRLPNLGIRQCCYKVDIPKIEIKEIDGKIVAFVED